MYPWFYRYWGSLPLDASGITKRKLTKFNQNYEFINAFENLFTIAMNQFEWKGFENTMDERFFEKALLLYGQAALVKYEGSYLTLASTNGSGLSLYGYPTKIWGYGMNGFTKEFSAYVPGADESKAIRRGSDGYSTGNPQAVVCWDNSEQFPMVSYIMTAAKRMADLIMACDVAVQTMKVPFIVNCEEEQVNSVRQVLNDRSSNIAAVVTSGSTPLDCFKVWNTGVNGDVLKAFWEQYQNVENQTRTIFGINTNDNPDKKERLLVDEVNSNNEATMLSLERRLTTRKKFCEYVKDCFGLEIDVEIRKGAEQDDAVLRELLRGQQDTTGTSENNPNE